MAELPEIPPLIRADILPSPLLSISQFSQFSFPSQIPACKALRPDQFFVEYDTNVSNISAETLKDLPIPSPPMLLSLKEAILSKSDRFSLIYAHLPSHTTFYYPPWILAYWIAVSNLREHVKTPWMTVESYLSSNGSRWRSPEYRRLCQSAQNALLCLPWCGNVYGFPDTLIPTIFLALYPSSKWLSTANIDQQLALLRQSLLRAGVHEYEILGPDFFTMVCNLYQDRISRPYSPASSRYLSGVGDDLLNGNRRFLCGVGNVNSNHWVAVVVNFEERTVYYGDSLHGQESTLKDAVQWWIESHTLFNFEIGALNITSQADSFNCGLYALNAIEHLLLPKEHPLLTSESIKASQDRLSRFIKTCGQDSEMRTYPNVNDDELLVFKETRASDRICYEPEIIPITTTPRIETSAHISTKSPCSLTEDSNTQLAPDLTARTKPDSVPSIPTNPLKRRLENLTRSGPLDRWCVPATAETISRDRERLDRMHKEVIEERKEEENVRIARAKRIKTEKATERKREERSRKKDSEIESGRRDASGRVIPTKKTVPMVLSMPSASMLNVAEASRPVRQANEYNRQQRDPRGPGRPRIHDYKPAVLVNWMAPLLWEQIDKIARRHQPAMPPSDIIRDLKRFDPVLFERLAPQTLGAWIDRSGDKPRWSTRTLDRVEKGHRPGGETTRIGVLVKYPDATTSAIKTLSDLRECSVPLTLTTIRGILIAKLRFMAPEIFTMPSPDGTLFACSDEFTKKFLKRSLGWSLRRSTRAGGKIPSDSEAILRKSFLRMAYIIRNEAIPSDLIVNSDQTQLVLAQGSNITYDKIGSKQVTTVGQEEKRAITVLTSVTNSGILLPFQTIYKGSTVGSLPASSSPGYLESIKAGFLFEPSKTSTYWSTIDTMKSFVRKTLVPYFDGTKTRLDFSNDQRSIWFIDCWSVHRSDEFLDWMGSEHPNIIVQFVPARMTGLFQPCDVGIQRIFKHSTRKSAHEDVVQEVLGKLETGGNLSTLSIDAGIKILRNRTVGWLWTAFNELNKPEIVKKAWQMCKSGDLNLSYESLTSPTARQLLRDLPTTDPLFFAELSRPRTRVELTAEEMESEDQEPSEEDLPNDDSSVPIEAVIDAVHGTLPHDGTDSMFIVGSDGVISQAEAEETLVEEVDGVVVDTTSMVIQEEGRGKRKKFRNRLYEPKNWIES